MTDYDVVLVGGGINSLVCASVLAKRGLSVCLLERNDRLGGSIRTEELTVPGFKHDVMSCWYPLFLGSPGYALLEKDLTGLGLEFCHTDKPTGVVLPDQRGLVMLRDRAANAVAFDHMHRGEGARYLADMEDLERNLALTFTLLGSSLWSARTALQLGKEVWRQGPAGLAGYFGEMMRSARTWVDMTYEHELTRALFAPWVLHTGLGPDNTLSGHMGRVIAFTLEQIGMPVVKGGSERILNCFHDLITQHGGEILLDTEAQSVIVENRCARGIATTKGLHVLARKAVVCCVPPARLYREMIPAEFIPQEFSRRAEAYRFGRADMQIHIALDSPAAWRNESMNDVACIHITSGINGISRAISEADSGLLPQQATIVVGQPAVSDPSRIPEGKGQLWIQLQELPRAIKGDAAGEIAPPGDGTWTSEVAERYADRIVNRLAEHIPGLKDQILGRSVISPVDLQRLNCNLVGGDPYCGDCSLDQFGIWRPFPTTKGHRTPIRKLWHIGASTHPGPGLGGVSGFLAAQEIS